MAHGADAAGGLGGVGDAAEGGGGHVAVLEGAGDGGAFGWVVAEEVEEFGPAPFAGVGAAAPVDGGEFGLVGGLGDLGGFAPGAVVAPEVVIVDGLHVFVDGYDAGAGGVDGQGFDGMAVDVGFGDGGLHGFGEGSHVVGVALGGVVGVFALAVEGVGGGGEAQAAFCIVYERHADG